MPIRGPGSRHRNVKCYLFIAYKYRLQVTCVSNQPRLVSRPILPVVRPQLRPHLETYHWIGEGQLKEISPYRIIYTLEIFLIILGNCIVVTGSKIYVDPFSEMSIYYRSSIPVFTKSNRWFPV